MLTIRPEDCKIAVDPKGLVPKIDPSRMSGRMVWDGGRIGITGLAKIDGLTKDDLKGYQLGLTQLMRIEKYEMTFSGLEKGDGSFPVVGPTVVCRDMEVQSYPWYSELGKTVFDTERGGKVTLKHASVIDLSGIDPAGDPPTVELVDHPHGDVTLMLVDSATRHFFLTQFELILHFCTQLTLRHPDGRLQHLRHYLWDLSWVAEFGAEMKAPPHQGTTGSQQLLFLSFPPKDAVLLSMKSSSAPTPQLKSDQPGPVPDPLFNAFDRLPPTEPCNAILEWEPVIGPIQRP